MRSEKVVTDKSYIIVEDLPIDQKERFYDWLSQDPVKTTPVVIEEEIKRQKWVLCAYKEDYEYWHDVIFSRDPNLFKDNEVVAGSKPVPPV